MAQLVLTAAASGTTTLTISAAESANYTKPSNKTVKATATLKPLSKMTPAEIKAIVDQGPEAVNRYLHIGDQTAKIHLEGRVQITNLNHDVTFRIVRITGDGHPIFQIACGPSGTSTNTEVGIGSNTSVLIGTTSYTLGTCMNRRDDENPNGTNAGGWKESYCRTVVMPQILECFPEEWRDIMSEYTIYADNTCGGTDKLSNITTTKDILFLPCEMNMYGECSLSNSYMSRYEVFWDWYAAGNNPYASLLGDTGAGNSRFIWLRDGVRDTTDKFVARINYSKAAVAEEACVANLVRPCFRV